MFEEANMDREFACSPTGRNKRNIVFCVYLMYFLLLIKDLFVFFKKTSCFIWINKRKR